MKKRIICGALAAVCLLGGVYALAASSADESLVSLSYLREVFLPSLSDGLQDRANQDTKSAYDEAVNRLEGLGQQYLAELSGDGTDWRTSDTICTFWAKRGDLITLSSGSTVLWLAGAGSGEAGLVDATAGSELSVGGQLAAGHRCINGAEDQAVTVTVLSDAAQLAVQGRWLLTESGESTTNFVDLVQSRDWFYDPMRYAVDRGLFAGTSPTEISPFGTMNRSMLATVLYRMDGSRPASYTGRFPDVSAGQWYTDSVEWAASAGVVSGLDDGTFAPFSPVTREQIAVMLYRYAGNYLHLSVSGAGQLSGYPDAGSVSGWARDAMAWAVGAGIITGSDGRLVPHSNATRAEVATMLQRFQTWAER